MRTHIRPHATFLILCLALAAAAAFAGDWQAAPPAPPAPLADSAAVANPPDVDESAMRARMEEARRRADAARKREDELRAQMDAARRRLEVAAQQLAALSAQMNGPMMQRVEALAGPTRVLVGIQLDDSSGIAGARVREVSPGGPAEQAGVRAGDLIVAVNGTNVRGQEPVARVVSCSTTSSRATRSICRCCGAARHTTSPRSPVRTGMISSSRGNFRLCRLCRR